MDNEQILNELKKNLIGDNSDVQKIKACMEKNYSNRKLNSELKEMLVNYLTDEEKDIYNSIDSTKVHEYTEQKIDKAIELYKEHDYEATEKLISKVITVGEVFKKLSIEHSYSFGSLADFILFSGRARVSGYDAVEWFGVSLSTAYQIMGGICIERENYNNALVYFDKAIENNPLDTASYFEKLYIYEKLGNDKMFEITQKAVSKTIYTLRDFAKYYRVLGYHYAEKGELKFSYFLYLASLNYDKNEKAYMELDYLAKQSGEDMRLTPEEIKNYLNKYDVEVTIVPDLAVGLQQIITEEKYKEVFSEEELDSFKESAKVFLSFYGDLKGE